MNFVANFVENLVVRTDKAHDKAYDKEDGSGLRSSRFPLNNVAKLPALRKETAKDFSARFIEDTSDHFNGMVEETR